MAFVIVNACKGADYDIPRDVLSMADPLTSQLAVEHLGAWDMMIGQRL